MFYYVFVFLGTKVLSLPCGAVPTNKKLVDIAEKLKPFIRDLIDHANTVSIQINKGPDKDRFVHLKLHLFPYPSI